MPTQRQHIHRKCQDEQGAERAVSSDSQPHGRVVPHAFDARTGSLLLGSMPKLLIRRIILGSTSCALTKQSFAGRAFCASPRQQGYQVRHAQAVLPCTMPWPAPHRLATIEQCCTADATAAKSSRMIGAVARLVSEVALFPSWAPAPLARIATAGALLVGINGHYSASPRSGTTGVSKQNIPPSFVGAQSTLPSRRM